MCTLYPPDDPTSQPHREAAARAALDLAEDDVAAFEYDFGPRDPATMKVRRAMWEARSRYQDLVRAPLIKRGADLGRVLPHNIDVALDLARAALDLDIDLLTECQRVDAYAEIERLEMDLDLAEARRDTPPARPPTDKDRFRQQVWAAEYARHHWEVLQRQAGVTYDRDQWNFPIMSSPHYTETDPTKLAAIEAAHAEYVRLHGLIVHKHQPLTSQGYPVTVKGPRQAVVNGYVKTRRTVKIDGVRVPVVEYV